MQALIFLVEMIVGFFELTLLLRLLLQLVRADFRNPISRAIVRITNPVIVPLRRALPAAGRIDTASVVAVVLVSLIKVLAVALIAGFGFPPWLLLLRAVAIDLVRLLQDHVGPAGTLAMPAYPLRMSLDEVFDVRRAVTGALERTV